MALPPPIHIRSPPLHPPDRGLRDEGSLLEIKFAVMDGATLGAGIKVIQVPEEERGERIEEEVGRSVGAQSHCPVLMKHLESQI